MEVKIEVFIITYQWLENVKTFLTRQRPTFFSCPRAASRPRSQNYNSDTNHKDEVWVNKFFFWYQLTRVMLDKGLLNGLLLLFQ